VSPGRNVGMSVRWVFASNFSMIRFDMIGILRVSSAILKSIVLPVLGLGC
jgi:hypothetical protein